MDLKFRKKYASLDSCVILRIIQGDILEQKRSVINLLLDGREYYVDDTAILECAYVLSKDHTPRAKIAEDLSVFLRNSMIHYNKSFFKDIFRDYLSHPSLSMEDLVLAKRAAETGRTPLYTFDKKFARQSKVAELVPSASNQQE